jgi:hypothetical protein
VAQIYLRRLVYTQASGDVHANVIAEHGFFCKILSPSRQAFQKFTISMNTSLLMSKLSVLTPLDKGRISMMADALPPVSMAIVWPAPLLQVSVNLALPTGFVVLFADSTGFETPVDRPHFAVTVARTLRVATAEPAPADR